MAWDGGGTFDRDYNFSADASAGIQALPERFDGEFDNVKAGLENCVTRDGQNAPTDDLPMGGNRHTGVAAAVSADQYLRADQYVQQTLIYVNPSYLADTAPYILSATPPVAIAPDNGARLLLQMPVSASASANRLGWAFGGSTERWQLALTSVSGSPWDLRNNDGSLIRIGQLQNSRVYELVYRSDLNSFVVMNPDNGPTDVFASADPIGGPEALFLYQVNKTGRDVRLYFNNNLFSVSVSSSGLQFVLPVALRPAGTPHIKVPVFMADAPSQQSSAPGAYAGTFMLQAQGTCTMMLNTGVGPVSTSAIGWDYFTVNYLAST